MQKLSWALEQMFTISLVTRVLALLLPLFLLIDDLYTQSKFCPHPHLLRDHMSTHEKVLDSFLFQWHEVRGGGESFGRNCQVIPNPGGPLETGKLSIAQYGRGEQPSQVLWGIWGSLWHLPAESVSASPSPITNLLFWFLGQDSTPWSFLVWQMRQRENWHLNHNACPASRGNGWDGGECEVCRKNPPAQWGHPLKEFDLTIKCRG